MYVRLLDPDGHFVEIMTEDEAIEWCRKNPGYTWEELL